MWISPTRLTGLVIAAAWAGGAFGAHATDLPARVYTKAPPPAAVFDWTGGYVGANAGVAVGGEGNSALSIPGFPSAETFNLASAGALGGGQVGYNYQFGNWVVGAEADLQGISNEKHTNCILTCNGVNGATVSQDISWLGTVRARIGYATGPILNYFTGGFAYGGVRTSATEVLGGIPGSFSFNRTKTGFTLGSGLEAAIGGNWTAKIEYLYVDLGNTADGYILGGTPHALSTEVRENIFRAGLNYRIGGPRAIYAAMPAANWRGLYVGGNGGSGIARDETAHSIVGAGFNNSLDLAPRGFNGGLQAGYNWQYGNWVYGLETDFQGSKQITDRSCLDTCTAANSANFRQKLEWFGTARGRVGYGVGPTLFYATGGLAYGGVKTRVTENIAAPAVSGSATVNNVRAGYAAGAGIETPLEVFDWFTPGRWTVKSEYLYIDLGNSSDSYVLGGVPHTLTTNEQNHIFRTGVNYRFDMPVAAKY
jgi:outer membrane immunogenic protein